jgi:hypothetical protein
MANSRSKGAWAVKVAAIAGVVYLGLEWAKKKTGKS